MPLKMLPTDALFLDFDGTLVDFAPTPESVEVSEDLRRLLMECHQQLQGALALISGRSLASLQELVALPLSMAGSHGAEWWFGEGETQRLSLNNREFLDMKAQLQSFAGAEGLLAEDKGQALAVHFRQQPEKECLVDRYIEALLARLPDARIRIIKGNCVRELQPQGVDKGTALARFMQNSPFKGRRPVYLGDDTTDEDAFAWVNAKGGLSIKVGRGKTCARERLSSTGEVFAFLQSELVRLDD